MNKVDKGRLVVRQRAATTNAVNTLRRRAEAKRTSMGRADGATPIALRSDLTTHPSLTMPLTFRYDNPSDVSGWIGGIEPKDESWIAFVAVDGKTLLWEKRDANGGVVGSPVVLSRKDLIATDRRKCETTALGDSAASGRFRIFKEGKIRTDYGLSIMNPSAGREVIRAFRDRGNDMMIDLRHFSIAKNATREQSEALGWIKCPNGLEYIDGDGLYAVNVEWTSEVLAGLKSTPPKWKYFSPLYDQDAKTKVITSLSNVALTNMPATHGLNRLAAERGANVNDLKTAGECLIMLMALAEGGDEKAITARDKMIALLGDNAQAAIDAASASESVEAGDDEYAAMSDDEKKVVAAMSEDMKATYMAGKKAMSAKVAAESDKKDEVATESDKKEDVAAEKSETVTAEMLMLMADGELAKSQSNRQTIVAELRTKGLIAAGGSTEKMLLSTDVSDKAFAEFASSKRSKVATIGGPSVKKIAQLVPATKSTVTVSAEARANTERLSLKLGTDPKKVLAKLAELG